jgi:hypothetical protein
LPPVQASTDGEERQTVVMEPCAVGDGDVCEATDIDARHSWRDV